MEFARTHFLLQYQHIVHCVTTVTSTQVVLLLILSYVTLYMHSYMHIKTEDEIFL